MLSAVARKPGRVRIICGDTALAVSHVSDSGMESATPLDLVEALRGYMTYAHKHFVRGRAAYDPIDGTYRPVIVENRDLYLVDRFGRLTTGLGYLSLIVDEAALLGYATEVGWTPGWHNHPNPRRFEFDWGALRNVEFRYRQRELLEVFTKYDYATIIAPPGLGKTHSLTHLPYLMPFARIHFISEGKDILTGMHARLVAAGVDAGMIGCGQRRYRRVNVVSADSLMHTDPTDRVSFKGCDIQVIDEVHKVLAECYLAPLRSFTYVRRYALTATLERGDGAQAVCEALCGPERFRMEYPEAVANKLVAPILVECLRISVPEKFAKKIDAYKTKEALEQHGVWYNEHRHQCLADRLAKFGPDVQILVLVKFVEHAISLKAFLPDYTLVYDAGSVDDARYKDWVDQGLVDPTREPMMTGKRRAALRDQFRDRKLMRVIATDVWGTGVDFPSLQVVVMFGAQGASNRDYQGPGRGGRLYEGKEYALVIDPDDRWNKKLLARHMGRRRNYKKHGWRISSEENEAS